MTTHPTCRIPLLGAVVARLQRQSHRARGRAAAVSDFDRQHGRGRWNAWLVVAMQTPLGLAASRTAARGPVAGTEVVAHATINKNHVTYRALSPRVTLYEPKAQLFLEATEDGRWERPGKGCGRSHGERRRKVSRTCSWEGSAPDAVLSKVGGLVELHLCRTEYVVRVRMGVRESRRVADFSQ